MQIFMPCPFCISMPVCMHLVILCGSSWKCCSKLFLAQIHSFSPVHAHVAFHCCCRRVTSNSNMSNHNKCVPKYIWCGFTQQTWDIMCHPLNYVGGLQLQVWLNSWTYANDHLFEFVPYLKCQFYVFKWWSHKSWRQVWLHSMPVHSCQLLRNVHSFYEF